MDGYMRLRIFAIVAVTLISIYVLLPTFLQDDAEARFADATEDVDYGSQGGTDLRVSLDVLEGDPETLAEAIEARLDTVDFRYDLVKVDEDGRIEITLRPGADPETIPGLLEATSSVQVLDATAAMVAAEDPAVFVESLRSERATPPEDAVPLALSRPAEALDSGDLRLWFEVPAPPEGFDSSLVLAVDAGVVLQVRELPPGESLIDLAVDDTEQEVVALQSDVLPGRVQIRAAEEETVETEEVAEVAESWVPDWVRAILPDTVIQRGIDLQGGIDLTLQVELDEAVLSQVGRDMTYIKENAAREGVEVVDVKRSRYEPWILIHSADDLSDVQSFIHKRMHAYSYRETVNEEGREYHVFEMRPEEIERIQTQAVEQVLETLRKRVDETGVKEPSIVKKGGGRINIQLPGDVPLQQAVDAIGKTAVLEFRMVDEDFDHRELDRMLSAARDALPQAQYYDDDILNDWLYDEGYLTDDHIILWKYEDATTDEESGEDVGPQRHAMALFNEVILTGSDVNKASTAWNHNQQPYVALEFKPQGANVFCRVTGENVGKRFAIILDSRIQSAPNIRERICGGRASITMGSDLNATDEAQTLALVLRTGSLNAPVSVGEVRQLGSSLGEDAIHAGLLATFIGGFVVFAFMAVWYRTAGIVADIALAINILLVMALLAMFGATLTLPGFAGLALTIGMAVDANIIIYERIREELRLGMQPRKAVDAGFEKAAVAVLDANITTAIAGVVLYSYGTGPIKGFAVTLLIGIATTLFSALFIARTLMELLTRSSTARLRI